MTDETTEPQPDTEGSTSEPQVVTIPQLWATFYEFALVTMVGNTLNKADKQQYRLKAAEVATALTGLEARRYG